LPQSSPLHSDLTEVREIAQSTLNNIRSLSQALHPVLLEEVGLESTLDWYIPTVERQMGLSLHYEKSGTPFNIESSAGVQVYRIAQEALNNVSKHAGVQEAWVRLMYKPDALILEVEDHGKGISPQSAPTDGKYERGIGLVAMRERAQLISGNIEYLPANARGTLVRMSAPREKVESNVR
jgi:two-component system sensor histidine kinase DegS